MKRELVREKAGAGGQLLVCYLEEIALHQMFSSTERRTKREREGTKEKESRRM